MSGNKKKYYIGIFIVVLFLVIAYYMISKTAEAPTFEKHVIIKTTFRNLAGLRVDAPVKLEGYSIGKISAINFPEKPQDRYFELEMEIPEKYLKYIEADSIAQIKTEGMLGDVVIEIKRGNYERGHVIKGDTLQSDEYASVFDNVAIDSELTNEVIRRILGLPEKDKASTSPEDDK